MTSSPALQLALPVLALWHFALLPLTALTAYVVYQLFLSPIADVPGPFFAKFTNGWKLYAQQTNHMRDILLKLHQKHGNLVRIGPNSLSISTPEQIKVVYQAQPIWTKTTFYDGFTGVVKNLFGTQDEGLHRIRRRQYASLFAQSNMARLQPAFDEQLVKFRVWMEKAADSGEPIDIRSIIHCLVVDTLFALCFGKSFGSLEHGDQERTPQVAYHIKLSTVFGSMPWTLPYMRRFGPYMPDWTWVGKGIKVRDQVRQMSIASVTMAMKRDKQSQDLLGGLIESRNPETGEQMSQTEMAAEAWAMIVAGTHTSSVTQSLFVHYLCQSRNKASKDKLIAELTEKLPFLPDPSKIYPCEDVMNNKLPFFELCMKETHRIGGVFDMPLPRIIPEGGAILDGRFIPGGIDVAMSVYPWHRQPSIWGDADAAEVFKPERYLEKPELDSYLAPFGAGPRQCVGRNLAQTEMYKCLPTLFRNYEVDAVDPEQVIALETAGIADLTGPLMVRVKRRTS